MHAPDPGHETRARRVAAVHPVRRERRKFEERAALVEQLAHPVAREQLAAFQVTLARMLGAAGADALDFRAQLLHLSRNDFAVFAKFL